MRRSTDIVIRIRGASDANCLRFPVEAQIDGSGLWQGESVFDFDKLDLGKLSKRGYGILLGQQLMNPGICRALDFAGAGQGKAVSIRLSILEEPSTARLRGIRWERMYLQTGSEPWPVAISPSIFFSRYIPDERPDSEPPADNVFNLLMAIANPSDLDENKLIDVEQEIRTLLGEFEGLVPTARFRLKVMPGRTPLSDDLKKKLSDADWQVIQGNSTLENIRDALNGRQARCHALHMICHGQYDREKEVGKLYLEDEAGALIEVQDYQMQSWIHPRLQLMVFQACRTAAPPPAEAPPFAGLAPRMVKFGVPAVIAMQDYVQMSDAREFSAGFYRALLRDGYVDTAVNEGRRAIPNAVERQDSTIPALFLRIKDGLLWRADPVRAYVLETTQSIDLAPPFPLKAVQHRAGLNYDPAIGPDGPLYDLNSRLDDLVSRAQVTCLTGPSGFDKSGQMRREFQKLAARYLKGIGLDPAPYIVNIADLARWARFRMDATPGDLQQGLQAVASGAAMPAELEGRAFVFLLNMDDRDGDLAASAMKDGLGALNQMLDRFPDSRAMVVCNEGVLGQLKNLGLNVEVLVVRPMEWHEVSGFLLDAGQDKLVNEIRKRQLMDIAGAPWMLTELQKLAHRDRFPGSRAEALSMIASSYLSDVDTRKAPRTCADLSLEAMAWRVQWERTPLLDNSSVLNILYEVRDRRDFRVGDLRDELVKCGIVAPTGGESLIFQFRALQSYYAARRLQNSPNLPALLEDITATLGRYSRMRHWEDVLIILAGLQQSTADCLQLLQALLAGSSMSEGEQIFLAARMYVEMADPNLQDEKVVGQIVDTLAWRSRPDVPRPHSDRRQAVECLGAMCHPASIPHLISLAVERFQINGLGPRPEPGFDHSSVRLLAVKGLFFQHEKTLEYLRDINSGKPPEVAAGFNEVVQAWIRLANDDPSAMKIVLDRDDPTFSPIAAFAIGQAKRDIGRKMLREAYFDGGTPDRIRQRNPDVMWALTEVLSQQDAAWLEDQVIDHWLEAENPPKPDKQLCYLIQKLGVLSPGSRAQEYLESCLAEKVYNAQGRALRALSKLKQPELNAWIRPLSEAIVQGDWTAALAMGKLGLTSVPEKDDAWKMQQATLEILRDIGNEHSLDVVRAARMSNNELVLSELSFQVAEEIYWRLSGGLVKESFGKSTAAGK